METKICTKCGLDKPINQFFKDSQKSSGRRPDCKACNTKRTSAYNKKNREQCNDTNTKYRTGVSREQYDALLLEQEGECAICDKTVNDNGRRLSIDHCHNSMYIRGLLCGTCNQGLGYFKDNPELLTQAIKYLSNNLSYKKIRYGRK